MRQPQIREEGGIIPIKHTEKLLHANELLYVRIGESDNQTAEQLTLLLPMQFAGRYLRIEVLPPEASDSPVKNSCHEKDCDTCGVVSCQVHYGNAELIDVGEDKPLTKKQPTIPGHPNCHYGECYNCHVVSCSIQQGWSEIPVLPKNK